METIAQFLQCTVVAGVQYQVAVLAAECRGRVTSSSIPIPNIGSRTILNVPTRELEREKKGGTKKQEVRAVRCTAVRYTVTSSSAVRSTFYTVYSILGIPQ